MLASMIGHIDTEEVKELRVIRDRSKVLEGEHAALQRRMKELEMKVANHEKVTQSSRQSLMQARQRAEEWEKRAKEAEAQMEVTQTKLDEVEQSHSQLDADYSLVKLQLEERDAEERLDKVCHSLRARITSFTLYCALGPAKQTARPDRLLGGPGDPPTG